MKIKIKLNNTEYCNGCKMANITRNNGYCFAINKILFNVPQKILNENINRPQECIDRHGK
jgi:hypothetical protein